MISKVMARILRHMFEKDVTYKVMVEHVRGVYDIAYIQDHNPYHKLDVYYPDAKESSYPILFNIHGGAWVAFDKEMNRAYSEYLASFGYCVVNMSYRLLPTCDIKGQLQDVASAIRYVMNDMVLPQGNKNQIVLMGDSAGAHLASMTYMLSVEDTYDKFFCTRLKALPIKALVLQNMISDMRPFIASRTWYMKCMCTLLFGKHYRRSDISDKTSFLELANDKTTKVPVFLVGSEHDPLYPQSEAMLHYLQEYNWKYETKIWKKTDRKELGHVFQVSHPEWKESIETHQAIMQFLKGVVR